MNKILQILIGLLLLVVPVYVWLAVPGGYYGFGSAALIVLKGSIMWIVIGIGLLMLLLGLMDLRE
jgi:hypothetical protein